MDMDMDGRRDLARAQAAAAREIDGLRAELAARCAEVVQRQGEGPMTPLRLQLAMREIDGLLDEVYGAFPGDPRGRLLGAITRGTARARGMAIMRSWRLAERAIGPELAARVTGRG